MRYVGLDLSKENIEVAILEASGNVVERFRASNTKTGLARIEKQLAKDDRVGMEAGTLCFPVHDYFASRGFDAWVGDPKRMRVIWDCDHKFDGKDAREIANLLRANMFPRIFIPAPAGLQERELVRARFDVVDEGTRVKNKIHAFLVRNDVQPQLKGKALFNKVGLKWLKQTHWGDHRDIVLAAWVDELESVQRRVDRLDHVVAKLVVDNPIAKRLISIPGIATLWAAILVVEVQDMNRFTSMEKFRSYGGSCPRNFESAGINRGHGVVKRSNNRIKLAIGMAAESATKTRETNPVKRAFLKAKKRGKKGKRALAPARRAMADTIYAVWKKNENCSWSNPERTQIKLNELERLASRSGGA